MSNKKGRIVAAIAEQAQEPRISLTPVEVKIIGYSTKGSGALVHPSLLYYQPNHQCFSSWTSANLRAFSSLIERVRAQSWQQVYQSAGKGENKASFGYTVHDDKSVLPNDGIVPELGADTNSVLTFFELRVTQRARIHCFRQSHFLFIVWLDGDHEVYAE